MLSQRFRCNCRKNVSVSITRKQNERVPFRPISAIVSAIFLQLYHQVILFVNLYICTNFQNFFVHNNGPVIQQGNPP